jgi:prophage tail gpP-like protein
MAMDKLSTTSHARNMSYPHLSTAIHKRKKKKKKVAKKKKKKEKQSTTTNFFL